MAKIVICLLTGLLLLVGCGPGSPANGRLRGIAMPRPAPLGGEYVVAERVARLALPGAARNFARRGNALYVFMNQTGLMVFDVADPTSPSLTATFDGTALDGGGTGHYFYSGSIDGARLVATDRLRGELLVFDLADPFRPRYLHSIGVPGRQPVSATRLGDDYLVSAGGAGLLILPRAPATASSGNPGASVLNAPQAASLIPDYDYVKQAVFYPPHWILAADNFDGGLQVLDARDLPRRRPITTYQTGNFCDAIIPYPGFAVLANRVDGFLVIDLSRPSQPYLLSHFSVWLYDSVKGVARWGEKGLLVGYDMGYIDVIDLSRPDRPVWLARIPTRQPVNCLMTVGDWLFAGIDSPTWSHTERPRSQLQVFRLHRRRSDSTQ